MGPLHGDELNRIVKGEIIFYEVSNGDHMIGAPSTPRYAADCGAAVGWYLPSPQVTSRLATKQFKAWAGNAGLRAGFESDRGSPLTGIQRQR